MKKPSESSNQGKNSPEKSPNVKRLLQILNKSSDVMSSINHQTSKENQPEQEEAYKIDDIDNIDIQDVLGIGGMGIVYSGLQRYPRRKVAIKKLKTDEEYAALDLLHEASILGKITHPNVPPVYQVRQDSQGSLEVIMQQIEGKTFRSIFHDGKLQDQVLREALQIILQVCQAVSFAHSFGIIHRDIKPENIMVGEFNQVYLVDWGIAVDLNSPMPQKRKLVGTPAYMAPEMLYGDPDKLSTATDVYLLGALLHHILTGKSRNQGSSIEEVMANIAVANPHEYDADIPKELATLCNRACARNPADRPQTVSEFHSALEEYFLHFEVFKLIEKGKQRLEEYKGLWMEQAKKESIEIDYFLLHQLSTQAKFSFEQALEIWPESADARNSLLELIEIMIEQALQTKEILNAEMLLREHPEISKRKPELKSQLKEINKKLMEEQEQLIGLERLQQDFDPQKTTLSRSFLGRTIIIFMVGLNMIFLAWKIQKGEFYVSTEQMFYLTSTAAGPILLANIFLYRRLTVNAFGKYVFRMGVYSILVALLYLYTCWRFEIDDNARNILEINLLTLAVYNASPAIRISFPLAIVVFLISITAMLLPAWSTLFFFGVLFLLSAVMVKEWNLSDFLESTSKKKKYSRYKS